MGMTCLLPLVHLAAISFSDSAAASANYVKFWPIGFNLDAYRETFHASGFVKSFVISLIRVLLGTMLNLFMIITASYPLSRSNREFKGRNIIIWFYVFPMMFSGGLIPFYLVVSQLGLNNNPLVLIIPGCVPIFSVIIMMNFFRDIPKQIYEAALIDGAGHGSILTRVFLPLSKASVATVALFSIVGHWNEWFTATIFLDKPMFPLQTYLRQLLVKIDYANLTADDIERLKHLSDRSFRAAQLFLATIPILCIYPFLQKYFVKGMTLGSVKE